MSENGTRPYPLPCPACGTSEMDCLSLILTSTNGDPEQCCPGCDHPLQSDHSSSGGAS